MAETRFGVRIVSEGGDRLKAEFTQIGAAGDAAFDRIEDSAVAAGAGVQRFRAGVSAAAQVSGNSTFAIRNVALQLSQVGQQATATGNLLQAVAIQLPDILGGFGGLPFVIAGAAIGLGTALIPQLLNAGNAAKDAAEAVDGLTGALDTYSRFANIALADTAKLREEYGAFAEEIQNQAQFLARTAVSQSLDGLQAASDALRENFTEVLSLQQQAAAADLFGDRNQPVVEALLDRSNDLAAALGLTVDEVRQLDDAFRAIQGADTMTAIRDRASEAVAQIEAMFPASERVPGPLAEAAQRLGAVAEAAAEAVALQEQMNERARGLDFDTPANAAARLADNLASAVQEARALAGATVAASAEAAALSRARLRTVGDPVARAGEEAVTRFFGDLPDSLRRSFLSGGPAEEVLAQANAVRAAAEDAARLAQQATEADRAFASLARQTETVARGTTAVARATEEVPAKVAEVADGWSQVQTALDEYRASLDRDPVASAGEGIVSSFRAAEDAVAEFVRTGKVSVTDFVASTLAELARLAFQRTITAPLLDALSGLLPGASGLAPATSLIPRPRPSFAGGGFTGFGPRSGGLDGQGGFLAMLHPRETVIDHHRGQAGGVTVNIHARDAESFRQSRAQIAADIASAVSFGGARR